MVIIYNHKSYYMLTGQKSEFQSEIQSLQKSESVYNLSLYLLLMFVPEQNLIFNCLKMLK